MLDTKIEKKTEMKKRRKEEEGTRQGRGVDMRHARRRT